MPQVTDVKPSHPWLSRMLLGLVDFIIALFVFVLPLIMGGREAWGHWFLISTALLLGAVWAAYASVQGCRYQLSWMELFFVAGLAIVWFQVQPQPPEVTRQFSGEYERLLPEWASTQTPLGKDANAWSTLSLTPVETQHALWMLIAYGIILTVMFQRVREISDCVRLLKWVAISGIGMTLFGLLQWSGSNGRFFWFYQHPYTDPSEHLKGAFTNRNHFAQFLSLSLGPLLWWLFHSVKRMQSSSTAATGPLPAAFASDSASSPSSASSSKSGRRRRRSSKKSRSKSGATTGSAFALAPQDADRFLTLPIIGLGLGVCVVGLAVMLSLSRGGMIAASASVMVALVGLWRGFNLGGAMAGIVLGGSVVFLSLLAFTDQEQVQSRVDQLISADADQVDAGGPRRAIWTADAKAILKFPWLGTGVGSHRDIYATYMENYADFATSEMTHAESSYVHLALETGFVGVACLLLALLLFMSRLLLGYLKSRTETSRSIAIAVAASATAGTLHAVTDFIWYVPAIVVISLILSVVGLKSISRGFETSNSGGGIWCPRIAWLAAGACCVWGLIRVQPELQARVVAERHWNDSLRTKLEVDHGNSDGLAGLQVGETLLFDDDAKEPTPEEKAALKAEKEKRLQIAQIKFHRTRIGHLARSLQARPNQHRIQLDLAEQLLKLFDLLQVRSDNPMPLNMIRDAATASRFGSVPELRDWVSRAAGQRMSLITLADKLARKSLANCPVQGHAYVSLVETGFLHDPEHKQHQALIDQAMLVRQHDPRVRFVAGREALMSGNEPEAIELWDSVFHANQYFRLNILQILAPQVAAEFFIASFNPNTEELKDLLAVYQLLERPRDMNVVLSRLCEVIPLEAPTMEDEDERLQEMLFASNAARHIKNLPLAADLLQQTVHDFPTDYDAHYALGVTLFELEQYEDAIAHLTWCHEWDPGNEWVPKMISWSRRKLLEPREERPNHLTQL